MSDEMRNDTLSIFISYSRADAFTVNNGFLPTLRKEFGEKNIWFDQEIVTGAKWESNIQSEIAKCGVFLWLISNEALTSDYCKDEHQVAKDLGKIIMCAVIRPKTNKPEWLNEIQHVDFSEGLSKGKIDENDLYKLVAHIKLRFNAKNLNPEDAMLTLGAVRADVLAPDIKRCLKGLRNLQQFKLMEEWKKSEAIRAAQESSEKPPESHIKLLDKFPGEIDTLLGFAMTMDSEVVALALDILFAQDVFSFYTNDMPLIALTRHLYHHHDQFIEKLVEYLDNVAGDEKANINQRRTETLKLFIDERIFIDERSPVDENAPVISRLEGLLEYYFPRRKLIVEET